MEIMNRFTDICIDMHLYITWLADCVNLCVSVCLHVCVNLCVCV